MTFTREALRDSLRTLVPPEASGLLIAYSGGLDSTVLLHAVAQLRPELPWPVRAMHVDHQLHADSALWAQHCRSTTCVLGIAHEERQVRVAPTEHGIEAAARDARYGALRAALRPSEVLVTAHHADDQAETLLLALMRGTGVRGLAGMPAVRRFGAGWLVRPLLTHRRAALFDWAVRHALDWLDDPSNADGRFSRNFLRADILPRLETRWPGAIEQLQAASASLAESAALLDELAEIDWRSCGTGNHLDLRSLHTLGDARQRNLLRWWLRERGARPPSRATLAALRTDMSSAAEDRVPHIDVDGVRVFRHRDVLYAESTSRLQTPHSGLWQWRSPFPLGEGLGELHALEVRGEGLAIARIPEAFAVRPRSGGERLRVRAGAAHRTLKNLLQETNVLPWWRERLPMLYAGERLCAVADLWLDADLAAKPHEPGLQIVWQSRPEIFAAVPARSSV